MDGSFGQNSWSGTPAELDDDDRKLRGLVGPEDEINEADSGFHLLRYEITPSRAPKWAVANWRTATRLAKASGRVDGVLRKLAHAKVADLQSLVECFKGSSEQVKAEWERYHPDWVAAIVEDIKAEHRESVARAKRDPGSQRSIKASLTQRQQRTWEAFRKLKTRPSRGTGKRQRGLSKAAIATQQWEAGHQLDASILSDLIVAARALAVVACERGLTNGGVLERLRRALDNLRDAIDRAKALKGPQQTPQEIGRRPAKPQRRFSYSVKYKQQKGLDVEAPT